MLRTIKIPRFRQDEVDAHTSDARNNRQRRSSRPTGAAKMELLRAEATARCSEEQVTGHMSVHRLHRIGACWQSCQPARWLRPNKHKLEPRPLKTPFHFSIFSIDFPTPETARVALEWSRFSTFLPRPLRIRRNLISSSHGEFR